MTIIHIVRNSISLIEALIFISRIPNSPGFTMITYVTWWSNERHRKSGWTISPVIVFGKNWRNRSCYWTDTRSMYLSENKTLLGKNIITLLSKENSCREKEVLFQIATYTSLMTQVIIKILLEIFFWKYFAKNRKFKNLYL